MIRSLILTSMIIAACGGSAVAEDVLTLETSPFKESYSAVTPVGGRVVVGAMLIGEKATPSELSPAVHYRQRLAEPQLCVSIISRDGRYRADNTYRAGAAPPSGQAALQFPTSYGDTLKAMGEGELALLSEVKANCSSPGRGAIVLSSLKPGKGNRLFIFINSGGATVTAGLLVGSEEHALSCEPTKQDGATAFDTKCHLALDGVAGSNLKIRVTRQLFERRLPAVTLDLADF